MNFKGKKIAILGFGVENRATYNYLTEGEAVDPSLITILDINSEVGDLPSASPSILGEQAFDDLDTYDLLIRTSSLMPSKLKTTTPILSAINIFFSKVEHKNIIGVTGTKGKGTTCTLITKMLEAAGETVHLVGNIGTPCLQELPEIKPNDKVVFELSSFQLIDIDYSPHIAVMLMIAPDHLDIHKDFDEYLKAKSNLVRHQTKDDILVHHFSNQATLQAVAQTRSKKMVYMQNSPDTAYVVDQQIMINEHKICSTNEVGLLGEHNLENVCAAITVAWQYTDDIKIIAQVVREFKGLPHRLQFVREVNSVKYYNDSQATTLESTLASLQTFVNQKRVIIFGGRNKGINLDDVLNQFTSDDTVVLIGESSDEFAPKLKALKITTINLGKDVNMQQIVATCSEVATPNSVVLLAPGHTSYDMFDSYQHRGNLFIEAVNNLE